MICEEQGITVKTFEPKSIKALQELNWTGNIRELRNVVERLIILSGKSVSEADVKAFAVPKF
jgi:DNA-binding NtrC family response regulator